MDILIWGASLAVPGEYVTLDKTFYNYLFEQKAVATPQFLRNPPVSTTFSYFFAFLEKAFIRNKIIILCINYIIMH